MNGDTAEVQAITAGITVLCGVCCAAAIVPGVEAIATAVVVGLLVLGVLVGAARWAWAEYLLHRELTRPLPVRPRPPAPVPREDATP